MAKLGNAYQTPGQAYAYKKRKRNISLGCYDLNSYQYNFKRSPFAFANGLSLYQISSQSNQ
jgi:hypothetical protein